MRRYFDPHYKPDRDHKTIVADNKRWAKIRADLSQSLKALLAPLPPEEADTRTTKEVFAALRRAEKRANQRRRMARGQAPTNEKLAFKRANAKRLQNSPTTQLIRRSNRHLAGVTSAHNEGFSRGHSAKKELREVEVVITELVSVETKLGDIALEIDQTWNEKRKRLLGERLGHLKIKRFGLRQELHQIGVSILDILSALEEDSGQGQ